MKKITKDTLILVFKIYIGNIDTTDVPAYINEICNKLKPKEDEDVVSYFLPVKNEVEHPIECINPKLLTENEFESVIEKLNKVEKELQEFLSEIKK